MEGKQAYTRGVLSSNMNITLNGAFVSNTTTPSRVGATTQSLESAMTLDERQAEGEAILASAFAAELKYA